MNSKLSTWLLEIVLISVVLSACAPVSTSTPIAIPEQGQAKPLPFRPTSLPKGTSDVVLPISYSGILPEGAVALLGLGSISVSVSPDGAYFVIWSDKEALLYDFATLKPMWNQAKSGGAVTWLAGGEHVAIGRIVWDIQTGDMVLASSATLSPASRWSPEASNIAMPGPDSSVLLLEAYSGLEIYRLELPVSLRALLPPDVPGYNNINISFSPDARLMATTYTWRSSIDYYGDGNTLVIWDVATGESLRTLSPAIGDIHGRTSIVWSPDGKRVATTSSSDLYVWDVETGDVLKEVAGAQYVTWSPDGSKFATSVGATRDGGEPLAPIRVWNNTTLTEEYTINEPNEAVLWSPDSLRIVTTNYGTSTRSIVHDAASGQEIFSIPDSQQLIGFNSDTSKVIGPLFYSYDPGDKNAFGVWDINGDVATRVVTFRGTFPITDIAWSPDSRLIAGAMGWWRSPGLAIWDVATAGAHSIIDMKNLGPDKSVDPISLTWSPGGSTLALSSEEGGGILVDANNLSTETRENLTGLIAYSPDGARLASAHDNQVDVLSMPGGEAVQTFTLDQVVITAMRWSPDGTRIALATVPENAIGYSGNPDGGSPTGEVRIWDIQSNEAVAKLDGVVGLPLSVAWSPDGKEIVAGFNVDTLGIWTVATGTLVRWLYGDIKPYPEMGYVDVDWSPDGIYIASVYGKNPYFRDCNGCSYGTLGRVVIWDAALGSRVNRYAAHTGEVQAVAFSPDSLLLASGALDGSIIIWDVAARPSEDTDD